MARPRWESGHHVLRYSHVRRKEGPLCSEEGREVGRSSRELPGSLGNQLRGRVPSSRLVFSGARAPCPCGPGLHATTRSARAPDRRGRGLALPLSVAAMGACSCLWLPGLFLPALRSPSASQRAVLVSEVPVGPRAPRALSLHPPFGKPAAWARGLPLFPGPVSVLTPAVSHEASVHLGHPASSGVWPLPRPGGTPFSLTGVRLPTREVTVQSSSRLEALNRHVMSLSSRDGEGGRTPLPFLEGRP